MPYTRVWDETSPPGTILANTIDTELQHSKTDIAERLESIFGLTPLQFAADPIVPQSLSLALGLTANLTGNVTGTILTPAQANITSLGILASLQISQPGGFAAATPSTYGLRLFTDNLGLGTDATKTYIQSFAAKTLELNNQGNSVNIGGLVTMTQGLVVSAGNISVTGTVVAAFSGNLTGTVLTAAQPNITSLGILTALSLSGTGSYINNTGASTNGKWIRVTNTSGDGLWGLESSVGGAQLFAGTAAYSMGIGTTNATSVHLATNNTVRFTLDSAGIASFTGAVSATGFTGNHTGTILTAAQPNITSLGTLTSLIVSSASGTLTGTFKRGDAVAFAGALVEFDRQAVNLGWIGSDGADALSILRGSDAAVALNIPRVSGIVSAPFGFSGNLSGNLTGTILTAAQPNITSHGILTGLTVNSDITMTGGGKLIGVPKSSLGNGLGAQITLAKVSTVAPPVANAAQVAWGKFVGDDAVTYMVPLFT